MSRLLYGSSNVYRHFPRSSLGSDLRLDLVECTKKTVFDSHIVTHGSLTAGSVVVVSVLENFITDVCRGLDDAEVDLFAKQQITAHVESVADLIRDVLESVAIVCPLLSRRIPSKLFVPERKK